MVLLGDAFDAKHLTNTVTGEPRSLEFRVQFHYNDHGQLKQISPWHDIPLYTPCGNVNMVVEIPKCAAPEPAATALLRPHRTARTAAPTAAPPAAAPTAAPTAAPAAAQPTPLPTAQVVARQVRDCHGRGVQPDQAGHQERQAARLQVRRHAPPTRPYSLTHPPLLTY